MGPVDKDESVSLILLETLFANIQQWFQKYTEEIVFPLFSVIRVFLALN